MSEAGSRASGAAGWPERELAAPLRVAVPPLLFGFRLWASVCLALFVAFKLELDNSFWAGTTAAIVCQPSLGASLRKGWYRMIGTAVGAVGIVVLTAVFPQDRFGFLFTLALWVAASVVVGTLLRNFSAYAAALAGYTAAIVASDVLGATGGPSSDVFMLAITRASEICIGIVSAGLVLAGTSFGGARRRVAGLLAAVAGEIGGRITNMLALAGPGLPETQTARRDLVRRAIALDPVIDEVFGESSRLRPHSPVLQLAVEGLISALAAWRTLAVHLAGLPADQARSEAAGILALFPPALRTAPLLGAPARWIADPTGLRRACETAIRALDSAPVMTPSLRLLADKSAAVLAGLAQALDGLALLLGDHPRPIALRPGFRIRVADWLPILIRAIRAFLAVGTVEVLWVITEWPNGAFAVTFTAIGVTLFALREEQAYGIAISFLIGSVLTTAASAVIKFALLPAMATNSFIALSFALAVVLVPAGAFMAYPWKTGFFTGVFTAAVINFVPLLGPANVMVYDTQQFYNTSLAILVGIAAAALSFRLMPPLAPALLIPRLLGLTLRDLRRLATGPLPPNSAGWENRVQTRLATLAGPGEPLQRSQLVAAFSVGMEIFELRRSAAALQLRPELDAALGAIAGGESARAIVRLEALDYRLAAAPAAAGETQARLRARGRILVVSEALAQHAAYFDGRATA
jgi:uncharacterized membrane protein YccC